MYLNRAQIIGFLGKDAEYKTLSDNRPMLRFSVATTKVTGTTEKREFTTWHNVVVWGKLATTLHRFGLTSGTPVFVEGEIVTRTYQAANGQPRTETTINASNVQKLPKPTKSTAPLNTSTQLNNSTGDLGGNQLDDEDLPF